MQHVRDAARGRAGADVDDLAVALRDHVRRDVLGHQEHAAHVDGHHAVPQRAVDLAERLLLERREQSGDKPIVAVNIHRGQHEPPELVVHAPDRTVADRQKLQLDALRAERDGQETQRQLARLRVAAEGDDNLIPVLIDCARADASLGEMVDTLRGVFGEFREPAL